MGVIRVGQRGGSVAVMMAIAVLGVASCGSSASDGGTATAPTTSPADVPTTEPASTPSTADPATLEGGCEILLGDEGVLDAALAFPESDDDAERTRVQERLFAIVAAENDSLGDPAGQLVDYLDDPAAYIVDGELSSTITAAEADIRETCDVL
ncbi:MAG: hypothetical protein ABWX74_07580 [Aeromicrobium sp.]